MKLRNRCISYIMYTIVIAMAVMPLTSFAQDKFSTGLNKSTISIESKLEKTNEYFLPRGEGAQTFIYHIVEKFVFPLLMIVSVLIVILGLYEIMLSGKDNIEKGSQYIMYGAGGIILIQSAKFITETYIGIVKSVVPSDQATSTLTFAQSAYQIYQQLLMPFVQVLMYAVIGLLFVILLIHVMRFIISSEEDVAAKAKSIMISNVVGIIVILLAKTMVEAIYGKQSEVVKSSSPADIGGIGSGILAGADFSIVFSIINYALGFLGLIILIIIIIQTYQLLVNPTSDDLIKKVKNNMLYVTIGLGIIALSYVIVNFIIIT